MGDDSVLQWEDTVGSHLERGERGKGLVGNRTCPGRGGDAKDRRKWERAESEWRGPGDGGRQ